MLLSWHLKPSFLGSWKHKRWKKGLKSYSSFQDTVLSSNISITHHAKAGNLDSARILFDEMPQRSVISWNAMISGYSKWGRYTEALNLASDMHYSNMRLNESTYASVLSACARSQSLRVGKQLHCLVLKSGLEGFKLVGSALLHFYSKCFEIKEARQAFDVLHKRNELLWSVMLGGYIYCDLMSEALDVFRRMPSRDVVAWTKVISGYSKGEDGCEKALELFGLMREEGEATPNEFTFDCIVRVCGRLGALKEGWCVHGLLVRHGFEADKSISDALIVFYCNCEVIDDANRVYNGLLNPYLDASNSLIGGLVLMGRIEDARLIFSKLTETDAVSYNLMIKGYAASGRVKDSERLFEEMPHITTASANTMISFYSQNGKIDKAVKIFEETKAEGNPVTWNSMFSGYIQNNRYKEALYLYVTMHRLSVGQTRSTFAALFHACSCLGSLQQGQILHSHLSKTPFESNVYVGTSLIDMYSKCGRIADAQKSFVCISSPNVVAWTALINAYANHGLGSKALLLFEHMLVRGIRPNAGSFVGILSACSRAGLVNEGMRLLCSMEKCYGVRPSLEHYACVVDLLGRAGCLREAEELIEEMPVKADGVVWGALLNSCWYWMDMEVGERVAEKMLKLNPKPSSANIILSNIYGRLGRWEKLMDVRKKLWALEVKKLPGCSWLEL